MIMKVNTILGALLIACSVHAQTETEVTYPPANVDFEAFEKLITKVKPHRAERIVSVDEFVKMSKEENTIILDTRSKEMYDSKHIKGAIHLNFSDFTQENLKWLIPNPDTRILIYCNNNFDDSYIKDPHFASKMAQPEIINRDIDRITLALNIPTYINLYGYGYRNVYELGELISTWPADSRIEFEGSSVRVD